MTAEQIWRELHDLFDTDDGSLPEIWITNLSKQGVAIVFASLQERCPGSTTNTTFWYLEDEKEELVNSVPNAATLVAEGRAAAFHFLCQGLKHKETVIPDLGVFVSDDHISLDYRMGAEWNAAKIEALFGILKDLTRLDVNAKVCLEQGVLRNVQAQFQRTWNRFLRDTAAA
jgi:hypothetical protein